MIMNEEKGTLVFYHANCHDGFGAAYAAWLAYGDTAEYIPVSYGGWKYDPQDRVLTVKDKSYCIIDKVIIILDFSFIREVMMDMYSYSIQFIWLDHHLSAFQMWGAKPDEVYIEDETGTHYIQLHPFRSGASIAYRYFVDNVEIPQLVKHIDDYDRWVFKIDKTKEVIQGLRSFEPWSFEQWQDKDWMIQDVYLEEDMEGGIEDLYLDGIAILRDHNKRVELAAKHSSEVTIQYNHNGEALSTFRGLAVNCPSDLCSDVGHLLAIQSGTFGACWYMSSDPLVVKVSLRSNGEYDTTKIAKCFGGGGHKNASGFEIPTCDWFDFLRYNLVGIAAS